MEPEDLEGLPEEYDREAIIRSLTRYREMIEDPEKVGFVLTGDVTAAVRDHHEDDEYAEAYESDRPMASALAKTLFQSDGSVKLILHINLFHEDRPFGDPVRHLEHEAHHVVMHERDETLHDLRRRTEGEREFGVPSDLVAMAGIACEEFRIERLFPNDDPEGNLVSLERLAGKLYLGVQETCQAYQRNADVETLIRGVLEFFHGLATWTAYIAAGLAANGRDVDDVQLPEPVEELVLGEPWREVVRALQKLPDAATQTERSVLEDHAIEVAGDLQEWLRFIGFDYETVEEGVSFLIQQPIQWQIPAPWFAEPEGDDAP